MAISNPVGTAPSGMDSLPLKLKDDAVGGSAGASNTDTPFEHSIPFKPVDDTVTGNAGASKVQSPFEHSLKTPK